MFCVRSHAHCPAFLCCTLQTLITELGTVDVATCVRALRNCVRALCNSWVLMNRGTTKARARTAGITGAAADESRASLCGCNSMHTICSLHIQLARCWPLGAWDG